MCAISVWVRPRTHTTGFWVRTPCPPSAMQSGRLVMRQRCAGFHEGHTRVKRRRARGGGGGHDCRGRRRGLGQGLPEGVSNCGWRIAGLLREGQTWKSISGLRAHEMIRVDTFQRLRQQEVRPLPITHSHSAKREATNDLIYTSACVSTLCPAAGAHRHTPDTSRCVAYCGCSAGALAEQKLPPRTTLSPYESAWDTDVLLRHVRA